jgi:thiol-disulfide isomerase/thioredoxin
MRIALLSAAALLLVAACKPSEKTAKAQKGGTTISVSVPTGFKMDTLQLLSWQGIRVKPIAIATNPKVEGDYKTFVFAAQNYPEGMYYVGRNLDDVKVMMLGVDKKISIKVDSAQDARFNTAPFIASPNNTLFAAVIDSLNQQGIAYDDLLSDYQTAPTPEAKTKIEGYFAALDTRRRSLIDGLKKNAPNLARVAGLYTYLSYPNNRKTDENEPAYFARSFFQFVDLKDTTNYRLPHFFESVKGYATNLSQVGLPVSTQHAYLDSLLAAIPANSPQHLPALLAIAFSYIGRENSTFHKYGSLYVAQYSGREPMVDEFLVKQLPSAQEPLIIGSVAPDFAELTPEGKTLKLSDLRGKVVLIDFWASWCGPCRKENPNVVKVYQQYKDKGFDVLSVSLDQDRTRWLDAIKADNMTWQHVSDLKGWQAAAGKLYGVSGIPFTVLVDKQGRIIGKNLRGAALEQELAKIFGK